MLGETENGHPLRDLAELHPFIREEAEQLLTALPELRESAFSMPASSRKTGTYSLQVEHYGPSPDSKEVVIGVGLSPRWTGGQRAASFLQLEFGAILGYTSEPESMAQCITLIRQFMAEELVLIQVDRVLELEVDLVTIPESTAVAQKETMHSQREGS